jgi:hypothetical protein
MSNGCARLLTEAGLLPSRSSTRRRVGSDSARNTLSTDSDATDIEGNLRGADT